MQTYQYLPDQITERAAWMIMHGGTPFYPSDPRPEEVHFDDIANSLSKLARFNGHTLADRVYSVAQHAVNVSDWMALDGYRPSIVYAALHHDDDEYIFGDMSSPVKWMFGKELIKEKTKPIKAAIEEKLDIVCYGGCQAAVKKYDMIAYTTEQGQLTASPPGETRKYWADTEYVQHRQGVTITPWTASRARHEFTVRHHQLRKELHGV